MIERATSLKVTSNRQPTTPGLGGSFLSIVVQSLERCVITGRLFKSRFIFIIIIIIIIPWHLVFLGCAVFMAVDSIKDRAIETLHS